jgi:hypothetical protein
MKVYNCQLVADMNQFFSAVAQKDPVWMHECIKAVKTEAVQLSFRKIEWYPTVGKRYHMGIWSAYHIALSSMGGTYEEGKISDVGYMFSTIFMYLGEILEEGGKRLNRADKLEKAMGKLYDYMRVNGFFIIRAYEP